jgi:hypothetical protein
MGIPTVTLITEPFIPVAKGRAHSLGMPDLRFVALPHGAHGVAFGQLPSEVVSQIADDCISAVEDGLTARS